MSKKISETGLLSAVTDNILFPCVDLAESVVSNRNKYVPGLTAKAYFLPDLHETIVNIGDWDMDANINVSVNHGIPSGIAKIKFVTAWVLNDTGTELRNLAGMTGAGVAHGAVQVVTNTLVTLSRTGGGFFDSTDFDSTSYNRGYLFIKYSD